MVISISVHQIDQYIPLTFFSLAWFDAEDEFEEAGILLLPDN